jgi:hypothetical protein
MNNGNIELLLRNRSSLSMQIPKKVNTSNP